MSTHPDLPDTLVHFTGRPRGRGELPDFPPSSPEQRLVSILHSGTLRGAQPFGIDAPVICFSEVTEEARRTMLRDGTGRGPYAPWGLVLDRRRLIAAGARPVLYVSREERAEMQATLPRRTYNRCVAYEPAPTQGSRSDWLHERERRICFEPEDEPVLSFAPQFVFEAGRVSVAPHPVVGVIVGTLGWTPPPRYRSYEEAQSQLDLLVQQVRSAMEANRDHPWPSIPLIAYGVEFAGPANGLARWYWNGSELVWDGYINIQAQEWETKMLWGSTLPGLSHTVNPMQDR
ncbi:hypothetical protein [Streptomyces sp. WMMC940]|uniref:hypothetical protein n=1 Tax=Streptomyces sp. WMMC940 TaxID=3015153 RepID=UPI0022B6C64D|nr:hypothetical protein [Streptomyces sp. WMMC940]MCZ7461019.1 hypothetical protein [Streptomyces sp. WMMC940]